MLPPLETEGTIERRSSVGGEGASEQGAAKDGSALLLQLLNADSPASVLAGKAVDEPAPAAWRVLVLLDLRLRVDGVLELGGHLEGGLHEARSVSKGGRRLWADDLFGK
jgi:hypothetical protein